MGYRLKHACGVGMSIMLATLIGVATASAESRIGVASAVSNRVTGVIGGAPRPLSAGDGVFQDQVVRTEVASTAQLLFIDETAFTVGPRSQVVLDRYVYNPSRRAGDIVMNVAKGAFRFISGAARSNSYRIRTPSATIGVRGTIFDGFVDEIGNAVFVLVSGIIEVCNRAGQCVLITVPGQIVTVAADGAITGPQDGDGRLWDVSAGVPFPLFGRRFENDSSERPTITPDDINDALDNRGLTPPPPPPPPPPVEVD